MKKIIIFILFIGQLIFGITGQELLKKVDDLNSLESDGTGKVKLIIQEKGQELRIEEMIYYRQDKTDSFLIVFLEPSNEKGNGYLKNEDNMWVYKKNTRTFQFINSDETIGSSKATANDFEEKKLNDDYEVIKDNFGKELIIESKLGLREVYKFEVKGKKKDVKDPKRIYWIDKETFLPLKVQNFALSGTLMETIEFGAYKKIDKSFIATKILISDELEKGNKTFIEISDISIKEIPKKIFTKAYLENLSK